MGEVYGRVRVAAVQAAPVFLNREATVEKACRLIRQAGAAGARIIGFPEGFIPGHPLWFQFHPATSAYSTRLGVELFKNAVEIPGAATEALCRAARQADAYVVMGLCERRPGTFGTLYNTQLTIDRHGQILGKHQKLVPTTTERLVHAPGADDWLRVYPTEFGRLSGLICGENLNPLAIFTLTAAGTMIHVASWPNHGRPTQLSRCDRAESAGRGVAMMTKAFVVNVRAPVSDEMIEILAATEEDRSFLRHPHATEGSTIIDPKGEIVARAEGGTETILYGDIDLELCLQEKLRHDFAGHYNRPDIFTLTVRRQRASLYQAEMEAGPAG